MLMGSRRVRIFIITFGAIALIYLVYTFVFSTPSIQIDRDFGSFGTEANIPDFDRELGQMGAARVGDVTTARFTRADREFGFEKLLHESGDEWDLEKPFMKVFRPSFEYDISSDSGTVRVETIAGQPSPTDAELRGNVEIHIRPKSGRGMNSIIYMDDVIYTDDKSEFSTAGPIRFVSKDATMIGIGMKMIYNEQLGRLEYLRIVDLEYLYLRTGKKSPYGSQIADKPGGSEQAASPETGSDNNLSSTGEISVGEDAKIGITGDKQAEEQHYRCTFRGNVVIQYGDQTVYAEEVVLNNLLWSESQEDTGQEAAGAPETVPQHSEPVEQSSKAEPEETPVAMTAGDEESSSRVPGEYVDVVVTCEDGITVEPTKTVVQLGGDVAFGGERVIEFAGGPVRVKAAKREIGDGGSFINRKMASRKTSRRYDSGSRTSSTTIARCEYLKYNLDSKVLELWPGRSEPFVSLRSADRDGRLRTSRSVRWDQGKNIAVINGPGKLFVESQSGLPGNSSGATMNFNSVMKVYFAEPKTANLLMVSPAIKYIDLLGGLEATMQEGTSRVAAESGKFIFDDVQDISKAELAGNVVFTSARGGLTSDKADIVFAKDTSRGVYAKTVYAYDDVAINPANLETQSGNRNIFHAKRIDYDVLSGDALASGPVEYEFYISKQEPEQEKVSFVPATVTAEKWARYYDKAKKVVFAGNVVGRMTEDKLQFVQKDEFHGENLIIHLADNESVTGAADASGPGKDVEEVVVTGGVVRLNSVKTAGETMISGIELKCFEIDYDVRGELIKATGPGKIAIDNSKFPQSKRDKNKGLTLRRPCYALIEDFETLQWLIKQRRIIAEGQPKGIHIGYLPIVRGKYGEAIKIEAGRVVADFITISNGREELKSLLTTNGIYYKEGRKREFMGSDLLYDGGKSRITVKGSPAQPCMMNGVEVENILYDLDTGRTSFDIAGIGALEAMQEDIDR
ncbi:MAG: hypothetical protein ABIG61_06765 [Planctomycetota bacterium]